MDKEVKSFSLDAEKVNIDTSLALRFLRVRRTPDATLQQVFMECLEEFKRAVSYKACYRYFDIKIDGKKVHFEDEMTLESEKLVKNLLGCSGAFVFVASTSLAVDRLIKKHSSLRVSKAVMIDAIGSSAVEGFCDILCKKLCNEYNISFRPRYSPGYGDLSILCQTDILKACDASRKIGVTLTDNHMMIPSKSVSAIVGVRPQGEKCDKGTDCENCESLDCQYRE